jgi:hypothetical protein
MNRKQRRKSFKKENRKKYSLVDVQKAINVAIEMKKHSKGHLYSKTLKDRCTFCGQSMKTKKTCDYWVLTLLDRVQTVLINPDFFRDDEIQALWLQHSNEYQDIKLPLNVGKK